MEGGLETAAAVEARAVVMVPGLEERETVVAMGAGGMEAVGMGAATVGRAVESTSLSHRLSLF